MDYCSLMEDVVSKDTILITRLERIFDLLIEWSKKSLKLHMLLPNRKVKKSLSCINLRAKAVLSPQSNGCNDPTETSKGYEWRSMGSKVSLWKVQQLLCVPQWCCCSSSLTTGILSLPNITGSTWSFVSTGWYED